MKGLRNRTWSILSILFTGFSGLNRYRLEAAQRWLEIFLETGELTWLRAKELEPIPAGWNDALVTLLN